MSGQTIAFTGGGSGGHIYPGLAVITELKKSFSGRLVWLGSKKDSDRRAVEEAGVEYLALPSGKLRRELSLENLVDVFRVLGGYFAAKKALRDLKPALLFSKGGYVSVPPCRAASDLGIPVFTHESDLSPGLATRLNAARAEKIFVAWEETREALPSSLRGRVEAVGNPMRSAIWEGKAERGRALLGLPQGMPLMLVMGGSQGARQVNELVRAALPSLEGKIFIVHQTGEGAEEKTESRPTGNYRAMPYIRDELSDIMAAADIVVTRAGAGVLQEASALGKALVLVPLAGSGTRGDQVDNARHFETRGAAKVLLGETATSAALVAAVLAYLDDPQAARKAGEAARSLVRSDSAAEIARRILERIGGRS